MKLPSSFGLRAALLIAFWIADHPVHANDPTAGTPIHGGVADLQSKSVLLSDPDGGIVAVELDTGNPLWTTKSANRPVAIGRKKVYSLAPVKGQPNGFRIVTLDAADKGKVVGMSDPVILPDWVDVGDTNDRLIGPRTFYTQAELTKKELLVRWQAFSQAAAQNRFGEARFDLATGKVTTAPGKRLDFVEQKLTEDALKVVRKRGWGAATTIEAGGRLFGVLGRSKDGAWVLTLQVADRESGDVLWSRVYQAVRPAIGP